MSSLVRQSLSCERSASTRLPHRKLAGTFIGHDSAGRRSSLLLRIRHPVGVFDVGGQRFELDRSELIGGISMRPRGLELRVTAPHVDAGEDMLQSAPAGERA